MRTLVVAFILILSTGRLWSQTSAQNGVMDTRILDFTNHRVALNGEWLWYDDQLLNPQELSANTIGATTKFPDTWNDVRINRRGQGFATYALTILVPPNTRNFGLEIPQVYSSYQLWVNGQRMAANGIPGNSEQSTLPQWMPQTVTFEAKDTIRLVLQIANFHHHLGGIKEPIFLGNSSTMKMKQIIARSSKIILSCTLVLLSVIFFVIYFFSGTKKITIYFSLLCLSWAVRSVFSNDYIFISFFPDFDWNTMIRIEYITLYLTMIWAILFLGRLFVNEGSQIIKYSLVTINSIFVAFTLFNPPIYFTKMLAAYLVTSAMVLLYGSFMVIRALINERLGARFLTVSILIALGVFSYDLVTYEGFFTYNSIVFSVGYLVLFFLLSLALLLHLGIMKSNAKSSNTLTYKDLYGEQN